MKTSFLFTWILTMVCLIDVTAQSTFVKGRYNFKLGYTSYPEEYSHSHRIPNYRLQADYGLLDYLEVGIYTGYSRFSCYNLAGGGDYGRPAKTLFYGVNLNFNPLTFAIKADDFRFDTYLTAKFGGHYKFIPKNYSLPRHMTEYSVGIGAAFYIWKHIGVFAEYNYGYFDYFKTIYNPSQIPTSSSMLRFGIAYKYRRK